MVDEEERKVCESEDGKDEEDAEAVIGVEESETGDAEAEIVVGESETGDGAVEDCKLLDFVNEKTPKRMNATARKKRFRVIFGKIFRKSPVEHSPYIDSPTRRRKRFTP